MDDNAAERTLKVKIGGREFPARPLGQGQIMALTMLKGMQATTVFSIIGSLVRSVLGEESQEEVMIMLASGEIDEHQLIAVLGDVVVAQEAAQEKAGRTPPAVKAGG